jgi:hypothetical protein
MFRVLVLLLLAAVPSLAFAEGKSVRDWTAFCDDEGTGNCITETTGAGGLASGGQGYRLQLGRFSGQRTSWFMQFIMKNVPKPRTDSHISLSIDGGGAYSLSQDYGYLADADGMTFGIGITFDLDRIFAAFRKGKSLEIGFESADGLKHTESFSLSGSVATMLWIDEQQKRVGNSSGIDAPTGVSGEAGFTASPEVTAKILKMSAGADCTDTGGERKLESYHLPGGKALHLLPCFSGPYNFTHLFFVERRQGDITQQFFADYAGDYGWLGSDQLFNIEFDPNTGWLHSFYKGRGIGDCGSQGEWVWHDSLFRLMEFRAWDDCENGREDSEAWPVIFTFKGK